MISADDVEALLEQGQQDAAQRDRHKPATSPKEPTRTESEVEYQKLREENDRKRAEASRHTRNGSGSYSRRDEHVPDDHDRASAHGSDRSSRRHENRRDESSRHHHHGRLDRPASPSTIESPKERRNEGSSSSYRRRSRSPRDSHRSSGYRDDHYDGRESGRGDRYRARSPNRDRRHDSRRDDRDRERDRERDRDREERGGGARAQRKAATPEPTDDERDRRTVFVQQIANRLRTRELEAFFAEVGPVIEAQIVKDRVTGRSKGVGYVEFKEEESVQKAIDLTGRKLLGIPIIVQLTEAEKNRQARTTESQPSVSNGIPFHRLYVGNIHFNISEDDLNGVFSQYGEVEFVQLQRDETARSRGYGFVQFSNPDDAKQALAELNGFELAGRPIRVGLGNDKMNQESNASMMQRMSQNKDQGSSFSGTGGRGVHAGGTANFDRANAREEKSAGNASALDDSDVGGVNFNNFSRDSLMRKLARTEDATTNNPNKPGTGQTTAGKKQTVSTSIAPSRCVIVKNAYKEEDETEPNWEGDLEEDFKLECSDKYGPVVHCGIPAEKGEGSIFVKFKDLAGGDAALKGLNGRFFGGRVLSAQPVVDAIYHTNFPRAATL